MIQFVYWNLIFLGDTKKEKDEDIEEELSKAKLFRFKTIHDFDYKSRSRYYKREMIKTFDKEIKEMRERK